MCQFQNVLTGAFVLILACSTTIAPGSASAQTHENTDPLGQQTIEQIREAHEQTGRTAEKDAKKALEESRGRLNTDEGTDENISESNKAIGIVAQDQISLGEGEMSSLFKAAAKTFQTISQDVPPEELARARCVAIFPQINTGGIIAFGAASGKGVATCRNEGGSWSQFGFVNLSSEKLGFQLGKKSTEALVLVYSEEAEAELQRGAYELSATASFVTSQQDKLSRAGTRDVAVFAREKGLFIGAGLGVTRIKEDPSMMTAFYREPATLTRSLTSFEYDRSEFPDYTNELIIVLPPRVELSGSDSGSSN